MGELNISLKSSEIIRPTSSIDLVEISKAKVRLPKTLNRSPFYLKFHFDKYERWMLMEEIHHHLSDKFSDYQSWLQRYMRLSTLHVPSMLCTRLMRD